MKAWEISTYFSNEFSDLVFADTRNEAKAKVLNGETALDSVLAYDDSLQYTDIRAVRVPQLDDRVKNTLQLITISFEDECDENYCEIIADWHTRSTTILRSSALEPDELLQVSSL